MAGYTRIGGSPDAGLTITLPQAMGYERALRFMMENRTANGDDAVAWGMAGEVADDDKLADRLAEYCAQLCEWSPITLRLLKRGMVQIAGVERHRAAAALRGRQHPHRLRQRRRQGSPQGLLRKAQAGIPPDAESGLGCEPHPGRDHAQLHHSGDCRPDLRQRRQCGDGSGPYRFDANGRCHASGGQSVLPSMCQGSFRAACKPGVTKPCGRGCVALSKTCHKP